MPAAAHGRGKRHGAFAEFLDAAKRSTKRDGSGRATQWGFVNTLVSFYAAGLFAMNNGVPWSTPQMNPTHLNFDNDAFMDAVQFYADLSNKHRVAPNASETQSMATPDLFSVGKAAIALGGHWRYQTFMRADGLDFDVAPLPVGPRPPAGRPRARISAPLDWPSQPAANARIRLGNSSSSRPGRSGRRSSLNPVCSCRRCVLRSTQRDSPRPTTGSAISLCSPKGRPIPKACP